MPFATKPPLQEGGKQYNISNRCFQKGPCHHIFGEWDMQATRFKKGKKWSNKRVTRKKAWRGLNSPI